MNDFLKDIKLSRKPSFSQFKLGYSEAILCAVIILVSMQFLGAAVSLPFYFVEGLKGLAMPTAFLVGGGAAVVLVILYAKTNWKSIATHLSNPTSLAVLFLSILVYLFMLPFAEFLTSIVPTEGIPWMENLYNQLIKSFEVVLDNKIAGFITICILAPIIEEILFRGVILRGLLQKGISPIKAIALSSFLFGIVHLNPWQFLGAGFLGAIFGFIYYRTKSLWLPVFLHALNNSVSFFLLLKYESIEVNVSNLDNFTAIAIFFVIGLVCAWTLYKLTENRHKWI